MRRLGIAIALGFLLASAFMNFQYGHSLGRTAVEGWTYGLVGVLVVGCNALCPFLFIWHGKRRLLVVGIAILWMLSATYSLTSAIGFAAENREAHVSSREVAKNNCEMTAQSLADLEGKRGRLATSRYDERIETLRAEVKACRSNGGAREADPQTAILSTLIWIAPKSVRLGILVLFGFIVELGAALLLFASMEIVAAPSKLPSPAPAWRPKSRW